MQQGQATPGPCQRMDSHDEMTRQEVGMGMALAALMAAPREKMAQLLQEEQRAQTWGR